MCVCPPALRKLRAFDVVFSNDARRTPRRHRLADGQLSSLYPPWPSFTSFGAASVMCCSPPASSSTPLRPSVCYPSINLVVNIMCVRIFCNHLNVLYIFDMGCTVSSGWSYTARMPRLVVSPLRLSPSHPPTPPPSRWRALITLPPLAKFQLVWRRLCEALLSSSLARQKHPFLLSRPCLNAGDVKVVLP